MSIHEQPEQPQRKHPMHLPVFEVRNTSVIIFLTVCAMDRRPVLATPRMHHDLRQAWAQANHWLVGRYVIMPDHIHLFCGPGTFPPEPLARWVAYWKRLVAQAGDRSLWQKNFWDTQLRGHESYSLKWAYVQENPVRAGLVPCSENWPYQGELNLLRWHE